MAHTLASKCPLSFKKMKRYTFRWNNKWETVIALTILRIFIRQTNKKDFSIVLLFVQTAFISAKNVLSETTYGSLVWTGISISLQNTQIQTQRFRQKSKERGKISEKKRREKNTKKEWKKPAQISSIKFHDCIGTYLNIYRHHDKSRGRNLKVWL